MLSLSFSPSLFPPLGACGDLNVEIVLLKWSCVLFCAPYNAIFKMSINSDQSTTAQWNSNCINYWRRHCCLWSASVFVLLTRYWLANLATASKRDTTPSLVKLETSWYATAPISCALATPSSVEITLKPFSLSFSKVSSSFLKSILVPTKIFIVLGAKRETSGCQCDKTLSKLDGETTEYRIRRTLAW